ncbi:plasmid stabilization system protein ParE [Neorhizobium galegae]|uniref:type II toxin-antitoxin system RelE/ParE family toxin n=1 Tax=Neorhizobium galegae TaxID=399 RepID=UPI001AE12B49|nr:type II toxin-antitoxin system RelE/ParE family toxin [Neorhizobium galegae]MBP2549607.1 plasmid stabilization system protein ParE [Neorhizobium galegae]
MAYRLSPLAERDIYQIMSYIALRNPRAALRWQIEIYATFDFLAAMPGAGTQRQSDRLNVSMFPKDGYLIFYQINETNIDILRVLHAARDWPKLVR